MKKKQDTIELKTKTKQLEEETRLLEERLNLVRNLRAGYNDKKTSKQMAFQIKTKKTFSGKTGQDTSKLSAAKSLTLDRPSDNTKDSEPLATRNGLEAFLYEINRKEEAYLRILKKAGCKDLRKQFETMGIDSLDALKECGTEQLNAMGMTRKKQICLEEALNEGRTQEYITHNGENKCDFIMQTDDAAGHDAYDRQHDDSEIHNTLDQAEHIKTNNGLEEIGGAILDINNLLNIRNDVMPVERDEALPHQEEQPLDHICHTCFSNTQKSSYQLDDNIFCSEVCYLAYKSAKKQSEQKILDYELQTQRYQKLTEQTKNNIVHILDEPSPIIAIEKKDIDLTSDIVIHYESDRLITKLN